VDLIVAEDSELFLVQRLQECSSSKVRQHQQYSISKAAVKQQ
jgi:hypothetical protein